MLVTDLGCVLRCYLLTILGYASCCIVGGRTHFQIHFFVYANRVKSAVCCFHLHWLLMLNPIKSMFSLCHDGFQEPSAFFSSVCFLYSTKFAIYDDGIRLTHLQVFTRVIFFYNVIV